jgi:hypothetical protein
MTPRRDSGLSFLATEYVTRPSPCPSLGLPMLIQFAPLSAVQAQSRFVLTDTAP